MTKTPLGHTLARELLPAALGVGGEPATLAFAKLLLGVARDARHPLRGYPKARVPG